MTPSDYEYLRKLLKERSGLDLSADKQYLVESRLLPLARKASLPGISELVAKMKGGADAAIALDDGPPVNFCKPAVDPLFNSAIDVWQGGIMSVILTGMGSDGMRGGKDIVAAGGSVIAQDEATSVVWGMPGAAANAGICAAVLPLNQIAPKLVRLFSGDRS